LKFGFQLLSHIAAGFSPSNAVNWVKLVHVTLWSISPIIFAPLQRQESRDQAQNPIPDTDQSRLPSMSGSLLLRQFRLIFIADNFTFHSWQKTLKRFGANVAHVYHVLCSSLWLSFNIFALLALLFLAQRNYAHFL